MSHPYVFDIMISSFRSLDVTFPGLEVTVWILNPLNIVVVISLPHSSSFSPFSCMIIYHLKASVVVVLGNIGLVWSVKSEQK